MLDSSYVRKTGDWISSTVTQINEQLASVRSANDAKLAKRRVRLFIDELEQKNREISLNMKEIRQQFDQQTSSRGLFSKRTRKDIDADRDKHLHPWETLQVALNTQITEMKRVLYEIDRQVMQ